MLVRPLCILFTFFALLSAGACTDENDNSEGSDGQEGAGRADAGDGESPEEDGGVERGGDAGDAGEVDPDTQDADADAGAGDEPFCPDGIVQQEAGEACDDGNFFDNDGCTSLCELTCEEDAHCDDGNPCNGEEACNAQNYCEDGSDPEDGESCGPRKSCFQGLCLDDVCGDTLVNEEGLGEECDDGNAIDDDGCTAECRFTCTTNSECEGGDPCAGTMTCDIDTHMCAADPLDNEALCTTQEVEEGWCIDGVCVPANCGDGDVNAANEQCDLGDDNGKPGSDCSNDCRWEICGDGQIAGEEHCDDGGTANLDGCDENCKAEVFMRWTRQQLLREPAPEWCAHPGKNQFASAVPAPVPVPFAGSVDVLDLINQGLINGFAQCRSNPVLQVLGLDDTTFKRSDDEVELAEYSGRLADGEECQDPMPVDAEFVITGGGDLDENNRPTDTVAMIQRPGAIKTESPTDLSESDSRGDPRAGRLKDFLMLLEVDTNALSTPPGMAASVQMPEEFGYGDPDQERYRPRGTVCAAMDVSRMASSPVTSDPTEGGICCKAAGGAYRICEEGDVPGVDCDSTLDLFIGGCILCNLEGNCDSCPIPFEVIRPTPLDVDTDGDGEEDAYSIVVGIEGKRVRVVGVDPE